MVKDFKKEVARIKQIRKKLSKVKVGLPIKVEFAYSKGRVVCYPKERKWIVEPKGKKSVTHIIRDGFRNDVTKYKARHFLKLALIGILRNDV